MRSVLAFLGLACLIGHSTSTRSSADIFERVADSTQQPTLQTTDGKAPAILGKMVDLGGYKYHFYCTGKGRPTVVLSAGAGAFATDWALVQNKVSAFTRVCSYDRSGAAWSDLGPKPRTMDQEAFDLHRLLVSAGEKGPYVLVGQSLGGMVVRLFADSHPQDVLGIVLVDAYSEDAQLFRNGHSERIRLSAKNRTIPKPRTHIAHTDEMTPTELQQVDSFIAKNVSNPKISGPENKLPEFAQQIRLWAIRQPKYYAQDDDYMAEISARMYAEDKAKQYPLGDTPLIVLTRDLYDYPGPDAASLTKEHQQQQADMVHLSRKGSQMIVKHSGHEIHLDAPDAVVSAIQEEIALTKRR